MKTAKRERRKVKVNILCESKAWIRIHLLPGIRFLAIRLPRALASM
jgi:hypothetical protein